MRQPLNHEELQAEINTLDGIVNSMRPVNFRPPMRRERVFIDLTKTPSEKIVIDLTEDEE